MQKVQSYLYPNRVILLADVAGFTVENKVVYARNVKIYRGVDNVIEFDIQNADQKRIDLTTLSNIEVNVMDSGGKALSNSPYAISLVTSASATNANVTALVPASKVTSTTITMPTSDITGTFGVGYILNGTGISGPVVVSGVSADVDSATTTLTVTFPNQTVTARTNISITNVVKGLATCTIPASDLRDLNEQYLNFSVTAMQGSNTIPLYCDSQFGAVGTLELVGNATPTYRPKTVYDKFVGEINFLGNVTNHSPAIPCKFYEAEATQYMNFEVYLNNFVGSVYVEATEDMNISVSSFLNAPQLQSFTCTTPTTTTLSFSNVPVSSTGGQYNYMRVSWLYPDVWQYGGQDPTVTYGSVTKVIACS